MHGRGGKVPGGGGGCFLWLWQWSGDSLQIMRLCFAGLSYIKLSKLIRLDILIYIIIVNVDTTIIKLNN